VKAGIQTLAKMTVTGGRSIATTSGLSKTKGMLKNVIKSKHCLAVSPEKSKPR
jgi:hypothetical protein